MLRKGVWYEVRTRINNREALFDRARAVAIFAAVLRQAMRRFTFRIRGLRLEGEWLRFYIRPKDGLELPKIMKWIKQVFAQRYNAATGRIGHIWGDRYWSRIVEGEPGGEEAGETPALGVRPRRGGKAAEWRFPLVFPFPMAPAPD
jgi:REP element-mobilizing transposase RayT